MEEQVTDTEVKKEDDQSTITREFSRDAPPILHLLVVGFHHKKGCQVEYSYPPLSPSSPSESHECPEAWKNLPSLAMPDGSHNFVEDTVYFHLPSITHPGKTVYGVSSYRQIEAKVSLKNVPSFLLNNKQNIVNRCSLRRQLTSLEALFKRLFVCYQTYLYMDIFKSRWD